MREKKRHKAGLHNAEMPPKPTNAVVMQRVEEILRIRLDGAEFWDVQEYIRQKESEAGSIWESAQPMSRSQIWVYISRSDKLISKSCQGSREKLVRMHLAKRRNLYAKAVSQGDIRAALAVAADEAKLLALYEREKLSPLELVLASLPPEFAAGVRAALAQAVSGQPNKATDETAATEQVDPVPRPANDAP